jgi:acetylglutamate kinase
MHTQGKLQALRTAIPYLRAYAERTFVVKIGGGLLHSAPAVENIVDQIALLSTLGIRIVVVHGGGEQVSEMSRRLELQPRLVGGRRVTDDATLEVVKMVLAGTVNTNLVAAFRGAGVQSVGLTGIDGRIITAVRRPVQRMTNPATGDSETVDFGHVGDITATRLDLLEHLLAKRYLPVIASLSADSAGNIYNVNADTIASRIAVELGAIKYFLLTTVDGVLRDVSNPQTLVSYMDLRELNELVESGAITGGMLPKLKACADALRGGVPRTHIVNGAATDALLAEVFTNEGCGTVVVPNRES